jgi:lysophospholipase
MLELQNDATDNLLGSLVIAGHFMIPEVCLFFNYKLFRGNRATKISSSDFGAFSSPNHPPLAIITSVKTDVSWPLIYRPTHINPFTIQTNLDTAHVACLRIFPGIKPEMVDGVLKVEGLRGLVLETFGAGNAPGGPDGAMTKVIQDAIRRGVVVVNVTQCKMASYFPWLKLTVYLGMVGSVSPLYAPATALGRAGVVFGHDMTSEG